MKIKIIKTPSSRYAFGGNMQTNSSDFSTGLVHIDAGGSHSENPNDGVQMGVDSEGTPNLVEEGETVYNDYVFSNRILADEATKQLFHLPKKKDVTFADISKKLEKEIQERPNDPLSNAGFKAQMQKLEEQQERQKQEMEVERAKAAAQEAAVAQQQTQQVSPEEAAMMQQQMSMGQPKIIQAYGGNKSKYDQKGTVRGEDGLIDFDKTLIELPDVVITGSKKKVKKPQKEAETIDYTLNPEAAQALYTLQEMDRQQKQDELMDAIQDEIAQKQEDRALYRRNRIHYYADGGLKRKLYEAMKWNEDKQFYDFANKYKLNNSALWGKQGGVDVLDAPEEFWRDMVLGDKNFLEAIKAENPALADAISKGYNWGEYKADANNKSGYDWDDFWGTTNEYSKQAGNADNKYRIDSSYNGDIRALENSDSEESKAYRAFTNYILNDASDEERMKYFQWIDDNTGKKNKYIKDGKLIDGWQDAYTNARNDGLYGIQHYTPIMKNIARGAKAGNYIVNDDGTITEWYGDIPSDFTSVGDYTWQDKDSDYSRRYFKKPVVAVPEKEKVKTPEEELKERQEKIKPLLKNEKLRYAGLFSPAVGLGMMAAGVGKPDYSTLNAAVSGAGNVALADYQPLGNYLTYRPMDIWYEQNRMNANARATDRAIMNSGANQGSKAAALLANGYNDQLASGELYRKALEYNDAKRAQVAEFNRGTDQFNADAYNRLSQFNASARNQANQAATSAKLNAAAQKLDSDAGWYNSLYGNVAGLFKGIGDLGTENARHNMIARMWADGIAGTATPDNYTSNPYLTYDKDKKKGETKSKGGKNRKKHDIIL